MPRGLLVPSPGIPTRTAGNQGNILERRRGVDGNRGAMLGKERGRLPAAVRVVVRRLPGAWGAELGARRPAALEGLGGKRVRLPAPEGLLAWMIVNFHSHTVFVRVAKRAAAFQRASCGLERPKPALWELSSDSVPSEARAGPVLPRPHTDAAPPQPPVLKRAPTRLLPAPRSQPVQAARRGAGTNFFHSSAARGQCYPDVCMVSRLRKAAPPGAPGAQDPYCCVAGGPLSAAARSGRPLHGPQSSSAAAAPRCWPGRDCSTITPLPGLYEL
ncbi:hypothetical protein GW7_02841 [Heterocephalus glaber]|uniref:Uncharacterized protein n=1 Tax=Heterocephalus glaber TaxID=10181 RepID=G5B609_HETGA|nr:hypothetical protein GW7_02841 [Heterocephalus glaber]